MNDKTEQFYKVLQLLKEHGLTTELILGGGWCLEIYKHHFEDNRFPVMQTQDIDILIRNPYPPVRANLDQILTENGFLRDYSPDGHVHYLNESLELEFITPAKGKGTDEPVQIKRLNITAQALRLMDIIQNHTEKFSFHGIILTAPNPCVFALVKLLVSNRRKGAFQKKAEKDRETAIGILEYLNQKHPEKLRDIEIIGKDLSAKLKKEILSILQERSIDTCKVIRQFF